MKDLTIVIVNYNVQYFLDQCIQSVFNSVTGYDYEIIVVDNNSVDGSVQMVKEKYPKVKLIANEDNPGFAIANNQAIHISNAKYVLLLNPDTILSEDTIEVSVDKMNSDDEIGALGIKMLDGQGQFLPESKRGLPRFWSSFYKMSGISKWFSKSEKFNHYHQGHLESDQNHFVDVLSGAFMLLRKDALNKTGLLDEQFFMYGEDIDLSYRMTKSGFKNLYLSESSIIHFKGESTKKSSVSYTKHFYNAMIIFNNKHFGTKSFLFSKIVNLFIFLSGLLAFFKRKLTPYLMPLIDFCLIYFSYLFTAKAWAKYFYKDQQYYKDIPLSILLFAFSFLYLISLFLNGSYDQRSGFINLLKGWIWGGVLVLLAYNFLPEDFRFSRAIMLLSFVVIFLALNLSQKLFLRITQGVWSREDKRQKAILLVGSKESVDQISTQFTTNKNKIKFLGSIAPTLDFNTEVHLGGINNLEEIAEVEKPDEIIFCSGDLASSSILDSMSKLGSKYAYRISSNDNASIIGSDSKNTSGVWYAASLDFNLHQKASIRQKRALDVMVSLLLIVVSPLILIFSKRRKEILANIFTTLIGQKTWIGYLPDSSLDGLPTVRKSVFSHLTYNPILEGEKTSEKLNFEYAQTYSFWKDLMAILHNL